MIADEKTSPFDSLDGLLDDDRQRLAFQRLKARWKLYDKEDVIFDFFEMTGFLSLVTAKTPERLAQIIESLDEHAKIAPTIIEESFATGLLKQEKLQRSLTDDLGKFLPQVEEINKGMEQVPIALKNLSSYAEESKISARAARAEAQKIDNRLLRSFGLLYGVTILALLVGVFLDEVLIHYVAGRPYFQDLAPWLWISVGSLFGFSLPYAFRLL